MSGTCWNRAWPTVRPLSQSSTLHRHESAASERGFGLGLPIVEAITRAHGGSVVAATRPGGGLEIRFEMALAPQGEPQGPMP